MVSHYIKRIGVVWMAALLVVCAASSEAVAHEGVFAQFNECPSTTEGVWKCLYAVTSGGEIILGNKATPIVNPVTLQGGYSEADAEGFSHLFAASNGETLSKTPQPVPGGLVGLVPPESAPLLVKAALKLALENGFTGVNATLELAAAPSQVELNDLHLLIEEEIALELPVKIHLENPFLGSSCYVGSNSAPIIWQLTTGATSPPPPNESIHGSAGAPKILEHEELVEITENIMVENAWSAPKASGCGGILAELVDPIIDTTVGLPAAAGKNTAILDNTIATATVGSVNSH